MSKKTPKAIAEAMSDQELSDRERALRREIPVAQALLSAVKRERIRRERLAKKARSIDIVGALAS